MNWLGRLDVVVLALMLAYIVIVVSRGSYRYHLARRQNRAFVRGATTAFQSGAFEEVITIGQVPALQAAEATKNGNFGVSNQIPFFAVSTWDDYEEGTEVETGIDNCYTISIPTSTDTPEVHGCIGSPRPPGFSALLKLTRAF
jgi:hypothetical protein